MSISPFKLERFFAKYEFSAKYLLSSSDIESLGMDELLKMGSPETLALWKSLRLGYTESQGNPQLRNEIAKGYENIRPEHVMIAAPEEAIFVAMHTLLEPGDHVIALSPTYQSLYEIARSIGCSLSSWDLQPGENRWTIDLDKLEDCITDRTRLLVINFPNNPTGFLPSRQEFDSILTIADKHGLRIFSDEMYRQLEPEPSLRLPSVSDLYSRGISLSGLSKSYALPGLRIGWLTTREYGLIERCITFKDYTTICNSAPSEILAIIAVQNTARIVARNLEIIRANTIIAKQFFDQHSDRLAWIPPRAGSIAFPRWLGPEPLAEFANELIEKQGIMIVPGNIFDYPGNHFRLGLGRINLNEALERVDEYLLDTSNKRLASSQDI